MKRSLQFSCPFQNLCIITKNSRRQCQACRLKKCLDIGMLKELIMSDKAVEQRRELIKKKKQRRKELPSTEEPKGLDPQQEMIIQELVEAQKKTFDISFSHFKQFREPDIQFSLLQVDEIRLEVFLLKRALSSTRTTEVLTGFQPHLLDPLLKFHYMLRNLELHETEYVLMQAISLFSPAGFQPHLLDPLLKFHYMLRNLELHETEYVLMQAISLFSPDKCQEGFALILKTYIDTRRSQPSNLLFPKIMACLTELRTMNDEYTKQVLKIQDIQPDVTPLMMEVFSNNP
ncbi:UNVERIFIED_CONTAM: hypothetical protein FKN15_041014 [Acipenser sinensis]